MKYQHTCKWCLQPSKLDHKYDSYYCVDCDCWCEGKCSDEDCSYCSERPDKPSDAGLV